ncbi:MAG TPA: type I polyketide synthase, partial [Umezawaea sp.]|nr:type I polyketide synthase [Umezawaea sp.]
MFGDQPEPVAVVGIGCRLPGGVTGPRSLWTLLEDGVDAVRPIPPTRWDVDRFYAPDWQRAGRITAREGGFLDEVDGFDAAFFDIPGRVAEQMDPQQRLLLEVCWEAFEDAGVVPSSLAGSRTGVFVGACSQDYAKLQSTADEVESLGPHSATGMYVSILSNRLSYAFDLRGPSMTVDTACSSSLVAVDLAVRDLRSGVVDLAVAGGVNLMLTPESAVALSQASMLSPTSRSRAFDASADGYARGEGAGVVVLKRLSEALRDRDRVYAVVRGTAVNQDGRTQGITVPNGAAQVECLHAALADAGIAARDIGYVEAHGTGTPVGDPIEATAMGQGLAAGREPDRVVHIGSIKTNIGHLEGGAGIAGLIKAVLAVHHRRIPPHLHFRRPHPDLDLDRWHLAVPTTSLPWPSCYDRAVVAVNSFGFGGTNANVVVEQPPEPDSPSRPPSTPVRLNLSARSEAALRVLAERHARTLRERPPDLAALAAALDVRRTHHPHRMSVTAADAAEAADRITAHLRGDEVDGVRVGQATGQRGRVAFLFNGQGPQWFAMGRTLLETSPVFRDVVAECDALAREFVDWSIVEALRADETSSPVHRTECLQPMMFAVQVGLARLWESWGIVPDGVIGHSMGEIAAAHLSGAVDLATALRVICVRSRIQAGADASGGMLFVAVDAERARTICEARPDALWVSAENGPKGVTLSGDRAVLAEVGDELTADGVFARLLKVNCACHSPDMDPLRDALAAELAGVGAGAATREYYSTVTGGPLVGDKL